MEQKSRLKRKVAMGGHGEFGEEGIVVGGGFRNGGWRQGIGCGTSWLMYLNM